MKHLPLVLLAAFSSVAFAGPAAKKKVIERARVAGFLGVTGNDTFKPVIGRYEISNGFDGRGVQTGNETPAPQPAPTFTGTYRTIGGFEPRWEPRHYPQRPTPSISFAGNVNGALDKEVVRRYVKRSTAKLSYCYEKALLSKPGIAGAIDVTFAIDRDGRVSQKTARGFDAEVATCVGSTIETIEFPKGAPTTVTYTFEFRYPS